MSNDTTVKFTDRARRKPHPARTDGKKYCPECEEVKPLSAFRADPTVKAGVVAYCEPCRRKLVAAWRKKRKLLLIPVGRKKCRTCKEVKAESEFDHPEYRSTACRPCQQKRLDRAAVSKAAYARRSYQAHRNERRARSRAWRQENPEEAKAKDRKSRQVHQWQRIDTSRVKNIRRAYPNHAGKVVPYSCLDIFCRDNWDCQLCGDPVDPLAPRKTSGGAAIFHVIPLGQDGDDTPENVVLGHFGCCARKGAQHQAQLRRSIDG